MMLGYNRQKYYQQQITAFFFMYQFLLLPYYFGIVQEVSQPA